MAGSGTTADVHSCFAHETVNGSVRPLEQVRGLEKSSHSSVRCLKSVPPCQPQRKARPRNVIE